MAELRIIPILGRKVNVAPDDPALFKWVGEGVAYTYDTGGINFDLTRKDGSCTKSFGYTKWSNSANATATKCLGLFELYDGTNRDHIFVDNGDIYIFDASLDPVEYEDSGTTAFASDNVDLYSFIKVGSYAVFTDRGEHTPYKWKNGDATLTKLIQSGTEYKFRWITQFARRVIGLYSDQTNGQIDVRYSTDWPTTAITSLNFPSANQLWIPNDDPIVGGKTMGSDRCFIYCEDSIHQLIYTQNNLLPFQLYTVVPQQGAVSHHSIVSLGDRHFLFNKNYGFCEYRGGQQFPSGKPISEDIITDIREINADYYNIMVGAYWPLHRKVVWTVPMSGSSTPSHLLFYDIDTGTWTIEDKSMRYVDSWRLYTSYTWTDLVAAIVAAGYPASQDWDNLVTWQGSSTTIAETIPTMGQRLVYANTDGHLYYSDSEGLDGGAIDGYRIEPIMDFGNRLRRDLLSEIWFEIAISGSYSIDIYHRSGDTTGELIAQSWTSLGSISCDSPAEPYLPVNKNARLHQIKWGTNLANEKFIVNGITFRYTPESSH